MKKKDLDVGRIPKDQDISNGDAIRVRCEFYAVRGWNNDCFNKNFKSVRFTENFKKNANLAPYFKVIKPSSKGNFAWISEGCVNNFRGVDLTFSKCENMYGQLVISFQNACFYCLVFLTHDIAV